MMINRTVARIHTTKDEAGFLGAGHIARRVVTGDFKDTDPFIFLMDDLLNKQDDEPAGGPHPHAGFETVSLLIDGEINEMMESMKKGDFQVMTAGSGIVHTEPLEGPVSARLLQMWLNLPQKDRHVQPRLQILPAEHVPARNEDGIAVRVYSGSIATLQSPVLNYTPLIAAEFELKPSSGTTVNLPADYNTFIYLINGSITIGGITINAGQVAWLDLYDEALPSALSFIAGNDGARFVLYSAKPTHESMISHGPFIADSEDEIRDLYRQFRTGKMEHISNVPAAQRLTLTTTQETGGVI